MSSSFTKWFLASAVLVGSLHTGETFRLMFDSPTVKPLEMFAVTHTEAAALRRS